MPVVIISVVGGRRCDSGGGCAVVADVFTVDDGEELIYYFNVL